MKFVITGALGHIGSRLVRELPLLLPDIDIVMIDDLSTQRYCSLFNLPTQTTYTFIQGDLLKLDLKSIFAETDVVIHLAAITNATKSFDNQEQVEYVNYTTSLRVAETCVATNAKMFLISSTSVYGTQKSQVDEYCSSDELNPQSPYAATKLKEEVMVKQKCLKEGLQGIILRLGTIFGTSPGMRFHTAVNKFCWQAVMNQPLTVWRTALHQKRPYLDLNDAVAALTFIINQNLYDGRVYNVLTVNATVNDLIQIISSHIPNISIEYVDTAIMNQLSYEVANNRFKGQGFEIKGKIEDGIAATIQLLKNSSLA